MNQCKASREQITDPSREHPIWPKIISAQDFVFVPVRTAGWMASCIEMAVRGIFGFGSHEMVDARIGGCQAPNLRFRAQALRRAQSDSSYDGWYACRDQDCSHLLGPMDRVSPAEAACPECGTTRWVGHLAFVIDVFADLLRSQRRHKLNGS